MNRRDFLRRGSVGAAAGVLAASVPTVESKPISDDFPETEEAMRKVMKEKGPAQYRAEGSFIQEGLNVTTTGFATYWYYLKGDRKAVLRENSNGDSRFYVERFKTSKPIYFPPLNHGKSILQEQRENNWPAWPSKRDKAL